MKTELIDRIVVEIKAPQGYTLAPEQVANQLRMIADEIDEGMKGNNYTDHMPHEEEHFEVLWEHECASYGFRMGDKSLICQHYYGSEPKPRVIPNGEFPVAVIMREDLENKGFKAADLNDETMEVIASKMSDYMLDELDYWSALIASCEWHGIPRKED